MSDPVGRLCLILHAHLPWVRHPESEQFLEEDWLHGAVLDAYLPLIGLLDRLAPELEAPCLTLSLSPTLVAMLDDELLRGRTRRRLGDLERLLREEPREAPAALRADARRRLGEAIERWEERGGDLVGAFASLADAGRVELIGCNATHGFLPLLGSDAARSRQIRVGVEAHRRRFGRPPGGMWLAECGWCEGLDELLAREGLAWTCLEDAALQGARPPAPLGAHAPCATPAGPVVFARDPELARWIWSRSEGYPGDPVYREFHRDAGYDLPAPRLGSLRHPDGLRRPLGLKLHKVTGDVDLGAKEWYEPEEARRRASEHAEDFLGRAAARARSLAEGLGRTPLLCAPFDAELFGHWWHEGPIFLEALLEGARRHGLELTTPARILAEGPAPQRAAPNPGSWGAGGDARMWLNDGTAWLYRHLHGAEARLERILAAGSEGRGARGRALALAARELLLAEASDWPFLMTTGHSVPYATRRVREHLSRFDTLATALEDEDLDERRLHSLAERDPLFEGLETRHLC